jgi:hypothetical protein
LTGRDPVWRSCLRTAPAVPLRRPRAKSAMIIWFGSRSLRFISAYSCSTSDLRPDRSHSRSRFFQDSSAGLTWMLTFIFLHPVPSSSESASESRIKLAVACLLLSRPAGERLGLAGGTLARNFTKNDEEREQDYGPPIRTQK